MIGNYVTSRKCDESGHTGKDPWYQRGSSTTAAEQTEAGSNADF